MAEVSEEITLPSWQPDDELAACSICSTPFTFLNRRHHCRRCGRLVCGPCSPHRITLPRQYIVRPPEDGLYSDSSHLLRSRSNTGTGNYFENPALGGGETVRVCNPCVPDPNYGPPPQHASPAASSPPPSDRSRARVQDEIVTATTPPSTTSPLAVAINLTSNETTALLPTTSHSAPLNTLRHSFSSGPAQVLASSRAPYRPELHTARFQALQSIPSRRQSAAARTRSDNDTRSRHRASSHAIVPSFAPSAAAPQQVFAESDECPVCGTHDAPFGASGETTARERHVEECLASHFAYRTGATPPTSALAPARTTPLAANPSPVTAPATDAPPDAAAATSTPPTSAPAPLPRRSSIAAGASVARQRMLIYSATEKDCFDEDGAPAECVICFEEFAAGDEMGRLECLCKFHRVCIRGWWDMKGRGTCPTHQLHD